MENEQKFTQPLPFQHADKKWSSGVHHFHQYLKQFFWEKQGNVWKLHQTLSH